MLKNHVQILVLLHDAHTFVRWLSLLALLLCLQLLSATLALGVLLFMGFLANFFLFDRLVVGGSVAFPPDLEDAEGDKDGERHEHAVKGHKNVVKDKLCATKTHQEGHLDEHRDCHGHGHVHRGQGG